MSFALLRSAVLCVRNRFYQNLNIRRVGRWDQGGGGSGSPAVISAAPSLFCVKVYYNYYYEERKRTKCYEL